MDGFLPPVVYLYLLRYLCYYRLNVEEECRKALLDLERTIICDFFILDDEYKESIRNFQGLLRLLQYTNQRDKSLLGLK